MTIGKSSLQFLPMKFFVVLLLSLTQASIVTDLVMPYSCNSCCTGLDDCVFSWLSNDPEPCLKVLPEGCNLTTTSYPRVTLNNDQVCPAPVDHPAASDYVTFSTSDLVGETQYGRLADILYISNVVFTKQDGCSYSMIAYPAPTAFPTECISPTIDAATKNLAEVHLKPADYGTGFTLYLNSTLPLTSVNHISLKATGHSCAPFTVLQAPKLIAIIAVTLSNTGEARLATHSAATSTVTGVDSYTSEGPSLSLKTADSSASEAASVPSTVTTADNSSEASSAPLTVSTDAESATGDSSTPFTVQGDSAINATITMTATGNGDAISVTTFTSASTVTGSDSYTSECPSLSLTADSSASEDTFVPVTAADTNSSEASSAPLTVTTDAESASGDSSTRSTVQVESNRGATVPMAVSGSGDAISVTTSTVAPTVAQSDSYTSESTSSSLTDTAADNNAPGSELFTVQVEPTPYVIIPTAQ